MRPDPVGIDVSVGLLVVEPEEASQGWPKAVTLKLPIDTSNRQESDRRSGLRGEHSLFGGNNKHCND